MSKLVRIKPVNKKSGNMVRRYGAFGHVFDVEDGWYMVDDDVAGRLVLKTTDPHDSMTSTVFDVVDSKDEAVQLEAVDRARKLQEARQQDYRGSRDSILLSKDGERLTQSIPDVAPETVTRNIRNVGSLDDIVDSEDLDDEEDDIDDDEEIDMVAEAEAERRADSPKALKTNGAKKAAAPPTKKVAGKGKGKKAASKKSAL